MGKVIRGFFCGSGAAGACFGGARAVGPRYCKAGGWLLNRRVAAAGHEKKAGPVRRVSQ